MVGHMPELAPGLASGAACCGTHSSRSPLQADGAAVAATPSVVSFSEHVDDDDELDELVVDSVSEPEDEDGCGSAALRLEAAALLLRIFCARALV